MFGIKKRVKKTIYKITGIFVKTLCFLLPLNHNVIILNSYYGEQYDDSPSKIADAIHASNSNVRLYWSAKAKTIIVPEYIRIVIKNSLKEKIIFSIAKVIISNLRTWFPLNVKKRQIYIQTWHGSFALKKIEKQIETKLDDGYVKKAKYDGSICTAILSSSKADDNLFETAFWLNKKCEILKYGLPRNDFIINNKNNDKIKNDIRHKIGVGQDDFLVLFAPTFRESYRFDGPDLDFESLIKHFESKIKKRCRILIRVHPNEKKLLKEFNFTEYLLDATNNIDMQELSLVCDMLISDYSSSVYDYIILKKPIILFVPDIKKYNIERGLTGNFYNNPFYKAYSFKELLKIIDLSNFDDLSKASELISKNINSYDDGKASFSVSNWILSKLKKQQKKIF